ncbi:hypothetical protein [Vulcanisaeta souniana]|uniref:Uncharacterized protein n=1 Tax=Vulcanisaeta souniana JCM 11219 TaxID=1293586 RepID=A0A830DZQ0_9CREN|nr:hypothetical protein [Vulcanisaeta souniana]BDR92048.1 hypothetical protein Vsou_11410 [Vulcanisaeta souniana JCM 11219]GGI68305.1 hypothetical protein GCM10007112_01660 [Vulcanisaeta souniana JCM 11219]
MSGSVINGFVRSLIGDVSGDVVKEVVRIGYAVASFVVYGVASLMKEGKGVRLSLVVSLSRVFNAGFMRDVFEVLIASQGDGDDVIDAAGFVSEVYMIKRVYGNERDQLKPSFLSPVKVDHDVYMAVYNDVRNYINDFEDKNNIAFGFVGNAMAVLLTTIIIMLIIGMCQGTRSEGYPDGIRDFLNYALTQGTHMALSELLSHG